MLVKVMEKFPAKKCPVFGWKAYGSGNVEASVEINVTGSRVTVEPSVRVAKLLGEVSSSLQLSELSAVKKAFEYLESKHFMELIDYSSKIVEDYDDRDVFLELNSVSFVLDKVLAEWSLVLDTVGKYNSELDRKEMLETIHGVRSAAGDIYGDSKNFISTMMTRYIEKHRAMYLEYRNYEAERSKQLNYTNDKMKKYIEKVRHCYFSFMSAFQILLLMPSFKLLMQYLFVIVGAPSEGELL